MSVARSELQRWKTWQEIHAQPGIWRDWFAHFDVQKWRAWLQSLNVDEIWFCGAGTSAYIGDILASGLSLSAPFTFASVPTTDLVARPQHFLQGKPKLIVNFGRSGNSAESVGTLDLLDQLVPDWPRLNITCNGESALADPQRGEPLILPAACHDEGFAMTSSFTTMLLTAYAIVAQQTPALTEFETLASQAEDLLGMADEIPQMPERTVYLGTGPLGFAARECALKVLELSAGKIPALWDSVLGFRHGPKSFVTPDTHVQIFFSSDPHARRYDLDLVGEMRDQFPDTRILAVGPDGDINVPWSNDIFGACLSVLTAQLQGTIWSNALGLNVDDPFEGQGTLTRVVKDVRTYPFELSA